MNRLFFGDNLVVLREKIANETADLIYLDPPFNSNAEYNLLYGTRRGGPSQSQSHVFQDTWKWGADAQRALEETAKRHLAAGSLLDSFNRVFPRSNMMAYLAMMGVRLIELHRVLKSSGSLYLHCDATAGAYLKVLLDAIFGTQCFRNEITWKRRVGFSSAVHESRRFGVCTDTLLFYSKSDASQFTPQYNLEDPEYQEYVKERFTYRDHNGRFFQPTSLVNPAPRPNLVYEYKGYSPPPNGWMISREKMEKWDEEGRIYFPKDKKGRLRRKSYADELKGMPIQNLWLDIPEINSQAQERLGYPTQKPVALLERVINASSKKGDLVLDPFCGCGTAIEAAQKLERSWIGIDVTYLAIHVIEARLVKVFGSSIKESYQLFGRPEDAHDAKALAARDWLEFQKWAVMVLGGLPKDKPGADGGIDGIIRYHRVGIEQPNRAVVSVKGGLHVGVDAIHKLKSVVQREKAELGVLVCLDKPTPAMVAEAASEGEVGTKSRRVPRLQIVSIDMLFTSDPVRLPGMLDPPEAVPYSMVNIKSKRSKRRDPHQTELLLPILASRNVSESKGVQPRRSIRAVDIEVVRPLRKKIR
jgi:site-specific DNA-methyltransferase (adenine-specific)